LDLPNGRTRSSELPEEAAMRTEVERGCGIDQHSAMLLACALVGAAGTAPQKFLRQFATTARGLQELRKWLKEMEVTHVAMEATGVYWMPTYEELEGHFKLTVANPHHIKKIPGRKSDPKDGSWIADLLRHGLIPRSFVPPRVFRELRWLTRWRIRLVAARTAERNRTVKLLDAVGIKLSTVMSDVFGVSGMLMLWAMAGGETNPARLAQLAKGVLRSKTPQLVLALERGLGVEPRETLRMQLNRLASADKDIDALEQRIARLAKPFEHHIELLCTIPGVDRTIATIIVAELGTDLSAFPSAEALAFWTGLAPGCNVSAGKRLSSRTTPGNRHLKTAMVEAAQAASRKKDGYLREKYYRLKARRGAKRAVVAVAHKQIRAVWYMFTRDEPYRDLGGDYLERSTKRRVGRQLVQRLISLGYKVQIEEPPAESDTGGASSAPTRSYKLAPRPAPPAAPRAAPKSVAPAAAPKSVAPAAAPKPVSAKRVPSTAPAKAAAAEAAATPRSSGTAVAAVQKPDSTGVAALQSPRSKSDKPAARHSRARGTALSSSSTTKTAPNPKHPKKRRKTP